MLRTTVENVEPPQAMKKLAANGINPAQMRASESVASPASSPSAAKQARSPAQFAAAASHAAFVALVNRVRFPVQFRAVAFDAAIIATASPQVASVASATSSSTAPRAMLAPPRCARTKVVPRVDGFLRSRLASRW